MIFDYRVDGYEVTDEDKELIEEKISKLEKFDKRFQDADEDTVKIHVNLFRGTRHNSPNFGLKIQVTVPGDSFRGEASGKTIADAIDKVELKLKKQITKAK